MPGNGGERCFSDLEEKQTRRAACNGGVERGRGVVSVQSRAGCSL